jgi:hypothetical protein
MIYCNLKGGLANMLFQIAATKSLAIDLGVDCSFPNLIHQYQLLNSDSHYNPRLKHSFEYNQMFSNLNSFGPPTHLPVYRFPFEFQDLQLPPDNFYIDGFFQSEKYFEKNKSKIIEFLKPIDTIVEHINLNYGELFKQRTTSIHVRRGDYLIYPNHHPTQSIEYYNKAIELTKDITDLYIIFSDDIEWCKNNIKIDNCIYIENEKDYIEINLMNMCNNNIIANSSFSLWGACMNQNKNKVVIGPKLWFGPAIHFNTQDVLNNEWIKI